MQRRSWLCQSITGAAIPACSITVYTAGTTTKATIYGDQAGSSSLGNPITAGSDGTYSYYAANGRYTEVLSASGFTFGAAQTQDFILNDPASAVAASPTLVNYTNIANVKAYGAKGDNVTDDTTAIQNAINAFGTGTTNPGGTIYFPPGEYVVSSTLTLPINVQLVGANTATDCTKASCLKYTSASAASCALNYPGTINAEAYVKLQIRDLQIAMTNTTTYGICLTGAADVTIDRVYIEGGLGGTNRGIYCQDCIFMRITRSHFNRMNYGIVADEIFNANTIANNQFLEMDQYAILLRGNVSGFSCCQGVWIHDNHFIKLAGASTYQGALHLIAPSQGVTFENNTLEVMQSTAILADRTDPIAGGGSGFNDGLILRGNLCVACVGANTFQVDYTRYSTLGPNVHSNPGGPNTQMYFVGNNASNNVIPPGSQPANKLLISDTGIVDTLVSDSGGASFYTGIQRTATNPATNAWGANHGGRLWWNTATTNLEYWTGTATANVVNAAKATGNVTITGLLTGQGVTPSVLFQPTTANNAEIWFRHGSVGNNSKFISLNTGVMDIYTADAKIASFGSGGGYFSVGATGGDKGINTVNASSYYIHGTAIATMPLTNASGTITNNPHMVQDTVTLAGGTAGVALAGAAAFTNSTSYTCVCDDDTAIAACRIIQNGGNGFTIQGTASDVVRFICVGN